jgi:hypothetical protein
MKTSILKNNSTKIFASISFITGISIVLFSQIGHFLTPARLIPSSFIGGTIGVILGAFFCFKKKYIDRTNLLPVTLFTLIIFGAISFVIAFNFNHPLLIFGSFFLIGLTAVYTDKYFIKYPNTSKKKVFFVAGLLLSLPALYFVTASILKVQFGYNFFYNSLDDFLNSPNGQQNFNAITPFLFGGGLFLSFFLNAFAQVEFIDKKRTSIHYRNVRLRINPFNFAVLLLTSFVGITLLSYLAIENLK